MAVNQTKKEIHELFVSNLKGTTLTENYLLVLLPLVLQACHSFWVLNFFQLGWGDLKANVPLSTATVVLPLILGLTVLSEHLYSFVLVLTAVGFVGLLSSLVLSRGTKYTVELRVSRHSVSIGDKYLHCKYVSVSQLRGCVLLVTAVCILAVDMAVFPRRWAKTESGGTGAMDLGVGAFSVLLGLLGASRRRLGTQFFYLVLLGTLRLSVVKALSYSEHETEYGRHWNFFYTLAALKGLSFLPASVSASCSSIRLTTVLIILVAMGQYLLLVHLNYEAVCLENVATAVRDTSLLVANKEGLLSLPGYVLLWLLGRLLSSLLRCCDIRRLLPCVLLCCTVGHLAVSGELLTVSRRAANLGYVIWASVCVCGSLLFTFILDIVLNCLEDRANYVNEYERPDIYSIINNHGLLHFLLANLLTGIVNLSIETLNLSASLSVLILCVYTIVPILIICCIDSFGGRRADCKEE